MTVMTQWAGAWADELKKASPRPQLKTSWHHQGQLRCFFEVIVIQTVAWTSLDPVACLGGDAPPFALSSSSREASSILSSLQQVASSCMWAALNISSTARLMWRIPTCRCPNGRRRSIVR